MRSSTRRATASPASTARTRGESIHHSAMQRSVGSPPCKGLAVTPYWFSEYCRTTAPSRSRLKKAFLSSSGSKVHSISSMPRSSASSRCRSFSRRPIPAFR